MQRLRLLPLLLLAACGGTPGAIAPSGLAALSDAEARRWAAETQPGGNQEIRFRFVFTDKRSAAAKGQGSASVAGADSLRFDFRGPLGAGRGAAVVIGDSAQWVQPKDQVDKLVPSYPLLWAMLGRARPPAGAVELRGRQDEKVTAWRYISGADTVDYLRSRDGLRLMAEVRQAGKRIGIVTTTFGPDGVLLKSRLDVPSGPARLDLTFTRVTKPGSFSAEMWDAPRDSL
ncbi:MAG: hypothetical protein IPP98_08510 [Gemmatimonadetes bacterium]|nr:hypothetical protein [Gemmatimonadota bacterium]